MNSPSIVLRIVDLLGTPFCVAAEDGQTIHDKIASVLREGRDVSVSFGGVETVISAFLNAAIGQLYGEFSEDEIRARLKVQDISPEDTELLERVVENAKRYFANKSAYDAAWKEEMDDEE